MKLDLHVHSAYSHDGIESIKKIIQTAQKRGLDGIAICDHNVFKAYEEAKDLAPEGFIVIPGIEYGTDVGHVLALFVTHGYDLKRDGRKMRSIAELRAAAKADGALLIAAHPFRKRNELPGLLIPNVDGVETMNSRDAAKAPLNSEKARRVAEKHGKFITGGSDAHILREIGACYTVLPDDTERTAEGVKKALLARRSETGGAGGRLRDQALGKIRRTRPKTLLKDIARLIAFTAKDVTG